jgi:nitrite reductase/ring-hydroxylating ferredoxin subunit
MSGTSQGAGPGAGSATRSVRFCPASELPAGTALSRRVAGRPIAVARLPGGGLAAFGALCPHQQADLSLGILDASGITCADHLWRFELPSGVCTSIPGAQLPVYPVREEAGEILVELPA